MQRDGLNLNRNHMQSSKINLKRAMIFKRFANQNMKKKNQSRVAQSDSDGLLKLLSSYNGLFISLSRSAIYYYVQISYYL